MCALEAAHVPHPFLFSYSALSFIHPAVVYQNPSLSPSVDIGLKPSAPAREGFGGLEIKD